MWAYDLAFLILGGRRHFRQRAPTSVAEKGVVVRHTDLPLLEPSGKILGSLPVPFNPPAFAEWQCGVRLRQRKTEAGARWSLNFALLPNRPRTAHNWTVTDGGNVVTNLFVGNLGSEVTHEELQRLFEAFRQVVQIHIIVDRDTGLPRRFAFVEMTNDAEAEKAIKALNGSILRDRTLDVNYARPRPERPAA